MCVASVSTDVLVLTDNGQTAIGTALPVIVSDLKGTQFVWVGSAYTLGATALLPFCGGLAQVSLLLTAL